MSHVLVPEDELQLQVFLSRTGRGRDSSKSAVPVEQLPSQDRHAGRTPMERFSTKMQSLHSLLHYRLTLREYNVLS